MTTSSKKQSQTECRKATAAGIHLAEETQEGGQASHIFWRGEAVLARLLWLLLLLVWLLAVQVAVLPHDQQHAHPRYWASLACTAS